MAATPVRKYWPLEFFLLEMAKDEDIITWIMDQVSILRAGILEDDRRLGRPDRHGERVRM